MAKGIKGSRSGRMKPCANCGAEFYCVPSLDVGGTREKRYCSLKCMGAGYRRSPEMFWARVDKNGPNGCWVWKGYCQRFGHGWLGDNGGLAHRYAWKLLRGELADDDCLLHKCDNPPCVNPDHLFVGDRARNSLDSKAKGRSTYGERNHWAKLTEEQVLEIRRLYKRTSARRSNIRELAKQYSVRPNLIYLAAVGITWGHLPGAHPKGNYEKRI